MKKLFLILSNIVMCGFFLWVIVARQDVLVYDTYPSVAVVSGSKDVQYDILKKELDNLAQQSDSIVARQISILTQEGVSENVYELLGQGNLPAEMKLADSKIAKTSSLVNNYFIVKGSLSADTLASTLIKLGFEKSIPNTPNVLTDFIRLFNKGGQFLGLLIFVLTYTSLIVIRQLKTLRHIGIRLISGQELRYLVFQSILKDIRDIVVTFTLISLLGSGTLVGMHMPLISIPLLIQGVLVYNVILAVLSVCVNVLLISSLKKVQLMQLIKGQIPLKSIVSVILIGQLLATIMVALNINHTVVAFKIWHEQEQGRVEWEKQKNVVEIGISRERNSGSEETIQRKREVWQELVHEAVEQKQALLVQHNVILHAIKEELGNQSTGLTEYNPEGNTIIVTPNYLENQHIEVTATIKEKAEKLQVGEYLLLLPETLKTDTEKYEVLYSEYMTNLTKTETETTQMQAIIGYTDNNQKRFIFNRHTAGDTQFLQDPIIIVVTPHAMNAKVGTPFWDNALGSYLMFESVEQANRLFEKYDIRQDVGYIRTGYDSYQEITQRIRVETLTALAGAIFGLVTAILLFNTLNVLYFTEFRREIFIKKLSGMSFFELHQSYLFMQISVLLIGAIISQFLTSHVVINWCVFFVFLGNMLLLLKRQSRKEDKFYVTILKGE
ncbi:MULTISPECIES: DUF1430 domain-containing protein [unclassified Granulicatella]|uniref:DUF1430 domain-containing protein n=1 Tax=unclassified Granulicatella TaxID=2630493 RepID=UPI001073E1BD|nr:MULTISPECIES: DUF1430 domain-containing protein [unclassified Granulicatella]MBF0781026.1 bacteriocin-associated integral membrane family protein [Granulicatella sp. 19428wC4_WM01]TFU92566.1 bacteriocin-associated integral membrane family protein [Granulicatella sp. WM01]